MQPVVLHELIFVFYKKKLYILYFLYFMDFPYSNQSRKQLKLSSNNVIHKESHFKKMKKTFAEIKLIVLMKKNFRNGEKAIKKIALL